MAAEPLTGGSAVVIDKVSKTYGDVVAVDNLSATIGAGEFFTILGPSGSGKSTTMMMLAGFTQPTSGEISVNGTPVANVPPQKRQLGVVFQNYAVFPHLNVYRNIAFPLEVRRTPAPKIKQRVGSILDLVHLTGYGNRMPRELSGGQLQRVALARALVFQPRVLLMDEPLGALDRKLREQMQYELRQLHKQLRVTMIYVTHDQEEALTMSDRVAIMNAGRMEQIDTPSALYDTPKTKFVADFLGETNFIAASTVRHNGCKVTARTPDGEELSGEIRDGVGPDQSVLLAVRPEKINVAASRQAEMNCWPGTIVDVVYAGEVIRYRVRPPEGVPLLVKIQNRISARKYAKGDRVMLTWYPSETSVFPV